jgi:hypothetical protein
MIIILLLFHVFVGNTAITMARQLQSESKKRVLDKKKIDIKIWVVVFWKELKELGTEWNISLLYE